VISLIGSCPVSALVADLKTDLHAHRRQVVAARKIIDIRAQSRPESFSLRAVFSFVISWLTRRALSMTCSICAFVSR
jgi:hypothetical protein